MLRHNITTKDCKSEAATGIIVGFVKSPSRPYTQNAAWQESGKTMLLRPYLVSRSTKQHLSRTRHFCPLKDPFKCISDLQTTPLSRSPNPNQRLSGTRLLHPARTLRLSPRFEPHDKTTFEIPHETRKFPSKQFDNVDIEVETLGYYAWTIGQAQTSRSSNTEQNHAMVSYIPQYVSHVAAMLATRLPLSVDRMRTRTTAVPGTRASTPAIGLLKSPPNECCCRDAGHATPAIGWLK